MKRINGSVTVILHLESKKKEVNGLGGLRLQKRKEKELLNPEMQTNNQEMLEKRSHLVVFSSIKNRKRKIIISYYYN